MGLDSVELLVSFENYFAIEVSDKEAEQIRTVKEMVNCVAKHLNISNDGIELKLELFDKLRSELVKIGMVGENLDISDNIFQLIEPGNKETWAKISENLDLKIPAPFVGSGNMLKEHFRQRGNPNMTGKQ